MTGGGHLGHKLLEREVVGDLSAGVSFEECCRKEYGKSPASTRYLCLVRGSYIMYNARFPGSNFL